MKRAQDLVGILYCEDCSRGGRESAAAAKAIDDEMDLLREENAAMKEALECNDMQRVIALADVEKLLEMCTNANMLNKGEINKQAVISELCRLTGRPIK